MAAIAGAAITAGAGLIGNMMSQSGQQATNAQSMAMMLQQEGWQEQMSDTAVQRRMADLRSAGVNPLLAVPSAIGPANVGGVGMPSIQNPAAAFGNMGQQAASAVQSFQNGQMVAANVDKANADAAQSRAAAAKIGGVDTQLAASQIGTEISKQELNRAYVELGIPAKAQADTANASLSSQQVQNLQAQLPQITAQIKQIESATDLNTANAELSRVQAQLASVEPNLRVAMFPTLLAQLQASTAILQNNLPKSQADANFFKSWAGQFNPYLHNTILPIAGAITSAAAAARGMPTFNMTPGASGDQFGNPDTVIGAPTMAR